MGDTKSAIGPASSREMVFANESIWTWLEVVRSFRGARIMDLESESVEVEGKDSTIVPMFDNTISH